MRLALLCDDPAARDWIEDRPSGADPEFVAAATVTSECAALVRGCSGIRLTPHWEDLLAQSGIAATLVGGSAPVVLEGIRQLASAGQRLIFLPEASQGSTFIYELGLIRDENHVPIHPAVWWSCDPAVRAARERIRSTPGVALLQCQRRLATASPMLDEAGIDRVLLQDLLLLRWLGGDYDQVTAVRTGVTNQGMLAQSVKLAGKGLPEAAWDVSQGPSDGCRITIHTPTTPWTLDWDAATRQWSLSADGQIQSGDRSLAVQRFFEGIAADRNELEWIGLVRGFETLDATYRSIHRRRTIELHFETMSERAIFKTQMTAIGCSVLIATFVLVLVYLAIASTVPLPPFVLGLLRILVFAPLGIFLALQLLYPLTRPAGQESSSEGGTAGDER